MTIEVRKESDLMILFKDLTIQDLEEGKRFYDDVFASFKRWSGCRQ